MIKFFLFYKNIKKLSLYYTEDSYTIQIKIEFLAKIQNITNKEWIAIWSNIKYHRMLHNLNIFIYYYII